MCTLVFLMSSIRFCLKSLLVMFQKTLFFCRFWRFFAFAFKTLLFLCWPFLLLVLNFCVFLFCFSCCCCCWTNQVAMFWFLFLLFWVSLVFYVVCVFFVCFWFVLFLMEGLRVKWGGPKFPRPKKERSTIMAEFLLLLLLFLVVLFLWFLLFCLCLSLVLFGW